MNKQFIIDTLKADGIEVSTRIVNKNGVEVTGYTFGRPGATIAPTVYLDNMSEERTDDEIIAWILDAVNNANNAITENVIETVSNFDNVRDKLIVIMRHGFNEDIITEDVYNMKKAVQINMGDGFGVNVTTGILNIWGIDKRELFEIAENNSIDTFVEKTMFDVMCEQIGDDEIEEIKNYLGGIPEDSQIVITNKSRVNGAGFIGCGKYLRKLYEKYGEFIILPSSIHEGIIMPTKYLRDSFTLEDMNEMVNSVSNAEVSAEEVLDYRAYLYNGNSLVTEE